MATSMSTPDLFGEISEAEPEFVDDSAGAEQSSDESPAIWDLLGCWFARDLDKENWLAEERDDPGWEGRSANYWIERGQSGAVLLSLRKLLRDETSRAATLWPFGSRTRLVPPTAAQKAQAERYTPPPHPCIYRWRFAGCLDLRGFSKKWRYVDPPDAWAGWPMRKTEAEGNAVVEPVTAALLEQLVDEAYERGRADEKFGCEKCAWPRRTGPCNRLQRRVRQKVRVFRPIAFWGLHRGEETADV